MTRGAGSVPRRLLSFLASMRRALLAAALLAPLASAAQAPADAAAVRRVYAFASGGAAFALDGDTKAAGFERGDAVEVGAGVRLAPHVAVELASGYVRLTQERSYAARATSDPSAPIEQLTLTKTLSATPFVASVRVSGRWGPVELDARGGAGAYRASLHGTVTSSVSPAWSFEEASTRLGVHAGAGVAATIGDDMLLGVDARYVRATARFRLERGALQSTGTTAPTALDVEHRLDSVVVSATVTYRF